MSARRRLLAATATAVVVVALGLLTARSLAISKAEAVLSQQGCAAQELRWVGLDLRATDIGCPGVRISSVKVRLWPRSITLRGADVDLSQWMPTLAAGGVAEQPASVLEQQVDTLLAVTSIQGLTIRMGERVLAQNLEGGLRPVDLRADGLLLRQRQDASYHLELDRPVEKPWLRGRMRLEANWNVSTGTIEGSLHGSDMVVEHGLLAAQPLAGLSLDCSFEGQDGDLERPWLKGTVSLGGPRAHWEARLDEESLPVIDLALPDSPAGLLLEPLEPIVPELRLAEVEGTIGLELHWAPGRELTAQPRLEGLQVTGAVEPDLGLDWGPFTTMVLDEDGERVPRRTGDGTPGWTPLDRISPDLVHAVLAAEDSAFFEHQGYDPEAIQAALDADIANGRVVRGGSTLTQQLAKNLFLDGEQTLSRKIRELLLAVELDHALGKDRVLELYLNVVEYGPGIHGVAAACDRYFMKKPSRLTPREAVFLAALLPSPRTAYQTWYLEGRPNRGRMAAIIDNMVDGGWLGVRAAQRAKVAKLILVPPPR